MTTQLDTHETTLAKPIAAEDLRHGDYVAVLSEILEIPSFLWCGETSSLPANEAVRLNWQSSSTGLPLRILDICLPFVFIKQPCGMKQTLDVRRFQLARLDRRYAKRVCKAMFPRGGKKAKITK
ncbi:MAG: hypothetical protein O2955_04125 [Planctomycetota bacterium]|nr:hypothetical protein [Planctomycetota bacterium]MDA1211676.1 hypothetical protein [Planctomycetota bacterium]